MRWKNVAQATTRVVALLLIVAVPASLYTLIVVRDQLAAATAKNLRTISEVGSQLDDRIDALSDIVSYWPVRDVSGVTEREIELHRLPCKTEAEDVAEAFGIYCDLSAWSTYLFQRWLAASREDDDRTTLDTIKFRLMTDQDVAAARIAANVGNRYCGITSQIDRINLDRMSSEQILRDLLKLDLAECRTGLPAAQLLRTLHSAYELHDGFLAAYRKAEALTPEERDAVSLGEQVDLRISILETAFRSLDTTGIRRCLAAEADLLNTIGQPWDGAELERVWTSVLAGDCSASVPTEELLEHWRQLADDAYEDAPNESSSEDMYLDVLRLLTLVVPPDEAPRTDLTVARNGHDERRQALWRYIAANTSAERTLRLSALLKTAETCAEGVVCIQTSDRPATRNKLLRQFQTNEWFRNLDDTTASAMRCGPAVTNTSAPIAIERKRFYRPTISLASGRDPAIVVTRCNEQSDTVDTQLQVPLRDLIPRRTFDSRLDGIFIADCHGNILYSDTGRELAVSNIREFGIDNRVKPEVREPRPEAKGDEEADAQCLGLEESWVARHNISGTEVMVFAHPYRPSRVVLDPPPVTSVVLGDQDNQLEIKAAPVRNTSQLGIDDTDQSTWYIIGLETESAFRRDARVLPFEIVVIVAPLIVVALLAWPFLVIALSGASVRFGRGAPLAFAASKLIGAGLVTIIALGLVSHFRNIGHRDALLVTIADSIEQKFIRELDESLALLVRPESSLTTAAAPAGAPSLGRNPLIGADQTIAEAIESCSARPEFKDMRDARRGDALELRCTAEFTANEGASFLDAYAGFEFALQFDSNGEHVGPHLTLREASSSRRNLLERAYFQRTLRDKLWQDENTVRAPFVIEPIRSKDFGWALASIAVSSKWPGTRASPDTAAVVAIKRFQTFFEPILPLGVGFAVVRDTDGSETLDGPAWHTGDVLFHSVESRALIENILNETNDDAMLARALIERRSRPVDVDYRGRPYRFFTKPLRTVPWTLIVTYDKSLLRMFTWRTMFSAIAAFLAYTAVLTIVGIVVERIVCRRRLPAWLWPTETNAALHGGAALVLTVFAVLALLAGLTRSDDAMHGFGWYIIAATSLASYGFLTYRFPSPRGGDPWWLRAFKAAETAAARTPEPRWASAFNGAQNAAAQNARTWWMVWFRSVGNAVGRSVTGAVFQLAGLALLLYAQFASGAIDPAALALAAAIVVASIVPERYLRITQPRGEGGYILFVAAVLLAVSVVPAGLLSADAQMVNREAYEKGNLAHIALATVRRETLLENELRRLQPATFNRAGVAPFRPTDALSCMGYFGFGAAPPFAGCGSQTAAGSVRDDKRSTQSQTKTATSWFASVLPAQGEHAAMFADGWRQTTDGNSVRWYFTVPPDDQRGESTLWVSVWRDSNESFVLHGTPDGLFGPVRSKANGGLGLPAALIAALLIGIVVVLYLAWRALATVKRVFLGSSLLRTKVASGTPSDWTHGSAEQKTILHHLADGHLINCYANERPIAKLVEQGIVKFSPELRIADEFVADKIRSTERTKAEVDFDEDHSAGTWANVRLPFLAVLGLALLALIVAAPDAVRSVIGIFAASAGGIGVLVQMLGLMLKAKG